MDITLNHVADGIVKESEAFDVLKAVFPTFLETGNGDLDEMRTPILGVGYYGRHG